MWLLGALCWISSTGAGCRVLDYGWTRRLVVVPDSEVETLVMEGQSFKAPFDGMFISVGRYRDYRQAVADRILELERRSDAK